MQLTSKLQIRVRYFKRCHYNECWFHETKEPYNFFKCIKGCGRVLSLIDFWTLGVRLLSKQLDSSLCFLTVSSSWVLITSCSTTTSCSKFIHAGSILAAWVLKCNIHFWKYINAQILFILGIRIALFAKCMMYTRTYLVHRNCYA